MNRRPKWLWLIPSLTLLLLAGCAKNPVSGEQDFVMLSESDEIQLGKQAHQDTLKKYAVYPDKNLQVYVNRIGQALAKKSHRGALKFTFTVLDSPEVNAFALPGGYIYITRGIMAYLNSEAELAAVIGHEIGHVTARHGVRQYSAAMATQFGLGIGALFIPELRAADAQNIYTVLGTALLRGYGREHELQADALGAEYLARSGYQTRAMIDVVRVLKNQQSFANEKAAAEGKEPSSYHGVFATHPDNDTRLQAVVSKATPLQRKDARLNKNVYMRKLDHLVFGNSEDQGMVRGNKFYHRPLDVTLSFPKKWRIVNRPTTLQVIAPKQAAYTQLWTQKATAGSRDKLLKAFFNVTVIENTTRKKVAGNPALFATARIKTAFGKQQAYVGVIIKNKQAFYFLLANNPTAKKKLHDYQSVFKQTYSSLRQLRKKERVLAKALRINIITANNTTRYATLARQSALKNYAVQQLRLMNAQYPDGEPRKGQRLKTVK